MRRVLLWAACGVYVCGLSTCEGESPKGLVGPHSVRDLGFEWVEADVKGKWSGAGGVSRRIPGPDASAESWSIRGAEANVERELDAWLTRVAEVVDLGGQCWGLSASITIHLSNAASGGDLSVLRRRVATVVAGHRSIREGQLWMPTLWLAVGNIRGRYPVTWPWEMLIVPYRRLGGGWESAPYPCDTFVHLVVLGGASESTSAAKSVELIAGEDRLYYGVGGREWVPPVRVPGLTGVAVNDGRGESDAVATFIAIRECVRGDLAERVFQCRYDIDVKNATVECSWRSKRPAWQFVAAVAGVAAANGWQAVEIYDCMPPPR